MSRSPSQKLPNCLDIVDRLMPKGTVLGGDQTLALHFLATSFLVIDLEQFFNDEQIEAIIAASSRITEVMVDQSQAQFQPQPPSKENAAVIQVAHALLVMREVKALLAELKNGGETSSDKLCNFYLAPYLRLASVLAKLQTAFKPDDQRSKVVAAQLAKVKQVIFTISDAVPAAMVENDSTAWSLVHAALHVSNDIYSDELALEVLKKIESALDSKLLDLRGVPESLNKFNHIKRRYLSVSELIRFFSNRIAAQFKEKADRFSFIQAAAEGFLLAGDSAGLRQLLPKFEAAVAFRKKSRTYSEDALFLARCKVVCAEDDKEFLTGLYGYFNQMPLPSKDFFKLVMPRAKAIYYDQRGRFSVEERHFAYQVFLGYERNTRHHVVLFNDPAPFPTDLVRPLEWYPETYIKQSLSSLKAADISGFDFEKRRAARGWEPSDEEQIMRQSILPILRQFNFIERYYYYKIFNNDSIGTQVSDRNNPENMQQYCIPLFFSAVEDVAFEYEKRLEQLEEMHSPSYEAGQTIFILRQFVYALLEARALKAIGQFLEKGESYQDKDFHALEALLYGSKVVQLRDTARTEVLSSILQSEPVRGLISYDSLGFKGALTNLLSAKGLDPFIMRNLRSIVGILKTLCLEAINPEYSSGLSDEVKLNALVFLLREPVYATLADNEQGQVNVALAEEYRRVVVLFEEGGSGLRFVQLSLEQLLWLNPKASAAAISDQINQARLDLAHATSMLKVELLHSLDTEHRKQAASDLRNPDISLEATLRKYNRDDLVQKALAWKAYSTQLLAKQQLLSKFEDMIEPYLFISEVANKFPKPVYLFSKLHTLLTQLIVYKKPPISPDNQALLIWILESPLVQQVLSGQALQLRDEDAFLLDFGKAILFSLKDLCMHFLNARFPRMKPFPSYAASMIYLNAGSADMNHFTSYALRKSVFAFLLRDDIELMLSQSDRDDVDEFIRLESSSDAVGVYSDFCESGKAGFYLVTETLHVLIQRKTQTGQALSVADLQADFDKAIKEMEYAIALIEIAGTQNSYQYDDLQAWRANLQMKKAAIAQLEKLLAPILNYIDRLLAAADKRFHENLKGLKDRFSNTEQMVLEFSEPAMKVYTAEISERQFANTVLNTPVSSKPVEILRQAQNSIDGPSFLFFSSKKATAKVERVSDFIKKNFSDENRSAGAGESLSATVSAASLFSSTSQTSDPGNPSDGGSEPSFVVFD